MEATDAKEATEEYDCIYTTRGVSKRMRFLVYNFITRLSFKNLNDIFLTKCL